MHIRFLLGPAGSGKTFRCLAEIREALAAAPDGPPLILLAPKQATFQLERQLLADPSLSGYTRLHILSFDRLAAFVFHELGLEPPKLLSDLGRLMVLRALLAEQRSALRLFHATARLPGFASQLNLQIREFQRHRIAPSILRTLAGKKGLSSELQAKLHDLTSLFDAFLRWLEEHQLKDLYSLPDLAAEALTQKPKPQDAAGQTNSRVPAVGPRVSALWLDGFAEMTPQELNLLAAIASCCERATITFCLDPAPGLLNEQSQSWLSHWSAVGNTFHQCKQRLEQVSGRPAVIETLDRKSNPTRFSDNPLLSHLEEFWAAPRPFDLSVSRSGDGPTPSSLRLFACANPESEATLAAREIRRFVRNGGRYREAAVIVRSLDAYQQPLERAFRRYEIPCFLDQRESAAHHPLAELTRGALRTVALDWQPEDWFGTLKTGLVPIEESALDWLENEALSRGWKGPAWRAPLKMHDQPELEPQLEKLRQEIIKPFDSFEERLARNQFKPSGQALADAVRELWKNLEIERQLEAWSPRLISGSGFRISNSVHGTVWEQMNEWLEMVELAFSREELPIREWLPILEAGLADLTVGVVPPSLDQVLVGTIDRSRNPDLKLAVVLGLNESVFPAAPQSGTLLTETDRDAISGLLDLRLGADAPRALAQEQYYGYIAFTRPRQDLVLSFSGQNEERQALTPSPFLAHLRRLFPGLEPELYSDEAQWQSCEHVSELVPALLRGKLALSPELESLPQVRSAWTRWAQWQALPRPEKLALSPAAVEALYGTELRTSVSGLEQFAACPFEFFANHGLRAGERKRFEADPRQTGSFQHEVLSRFHQQIAEEKKRWRNLTPEQARERVAKIGAALLPSFSGGLFEADAKSRFVAAGLIAQLQEFIGAVVAWMSQYKFDPQAVELSFGMNQGLPAWRLDLGHGRALLLRGKIDRVDLYQEPGGDAAVAVVMDYKSSGKKIDPTRLEHGLELQLLAYLGVLRRLQDPKAFFHVSALSPGGVFYVPLRAAAGARRNRTEMLEESASPSARYPHSGRFDRSLLPLLDSSGSRTGTQFKYALTKSDEFYKKDKDPMASAEFIQLLDHVEELVRQHAQRIFSGAVQADPYRKGSERACAVCDCQSICRFDPWLNTFRVLRKSAAPAEGGSE